MDSLPSVENDVEEDLLTNGVREYLLAFFFSVGFGDVHEGGGKRVVSDEGGGKANDGK